MYTGDFMKRVVVVGAGASGIIASIFASSNNEVIVLERNTSPLKKLLLTGNGKCNVTNLDFSNMSVLKQMAGQNKMLFPDAWFCDFRAVD